MQKSHCFFKISTVVVGMGLVSQAFAAGFQINEMSPTIQATALANAATATGDVTGQAYNPATLTTVPGTQVYVGGSLIVPNVNFNNASAQVRNLPFGGSANVGGTTSGDNISPTAGVPAIYASTHAADLPNLAMGFGVNTQWGLSTDYPDTWTGVYNSIDSSIKTVDLTPSIAYQVEPWLSLGAGMNVQYFSATLSNDAIQNFDSVVAVSSFNSLSGSSWGVGYDLGALLTPHAGTEIGIGYRSPVTQKIDGNITGKVFPNSIYPNGAPVNGTGSTTITMPAVLDMGISQQITSKLTLMANAQRTFWDSIQNLNIGANVSTPVQSTLNDVNVLDWSNSWLFSVGGSYQLDPKWKLMAGAAYDETPTNNTDRDARIPDTNRKWLSGGFIYQATQNLALDATYTHIFMNDQSIYNVSNPGGSGQPTYTTAADYSGYANIIAAGLNYKF